MPNKELRDKLIDLLKEYDSKRIEEEFENLKECEIIINEYVVFFNHHGEMIIKQYNSNYTLLNLFQIKIKYYKKYQNGEFIYCVDIDDSYYNNEVSKNNKEALFKNLVDNLSEIYLERITTNIDNETKNNVTLLKHQLETDEKEREKMNES